MCFSTPALALDITVGDVFCRPPLPVQPGAQEGGTFVYIVRKIARNENQYYFMVEVFIPVLEQTRFVWVLIFEDAVGRLYLGDGSILLLVVKCKQT